MSMDGGDLSPARMNSAMDEVEKRTLYGLPSAAKRIRIKPLPHNRPVVNLVLFILTVLSTYLLGGIWYSATILMILLAHEMGHYLTCRFYGIPVTLPFFIPFPYLNPFGTMGALIQIRGAIPNRRALFDIGAAGPLAGLVLTLPAIYFGIARSEIVAVAQIDQTGISLGESLIFKLLSVLAVGSVPEGSDILLHPMAYAGWAGLFVTSLNLLPIGQLDGGHISYSMAGRNWHRLNRVFLIGLGILTVIYVGWAVLFLLLLLLGRRHPPPVDDITPLDKYRRILGYLIFVIFLLSFTPVPIKL